MNRFKAKASKRSGAIALKLLEKMPELEALSMMASLDFEFNFKECPGKVLMETKDLSFGYSEKQLISDSISRF